jgi:CheY-like chemotaxis protein
MDATTLSCTPARILVAEDSQRFRQFISSTLQTRPGWRVICEVADGLEAVQKADELQPDLIVLDIRLPKLSGIDAAKRISKVVPQSS